MPVDTFRVHGYVTVGRIYGGEWGVHVDNPPGGSFPMRDIPALLATIARYADIAEGKNIAEAEGTW